MENEQKKQLKTKWFSFQGAWEPQLRALPKDQLADLVLYALQYLNTGEEPDIKEPLLKYAFIPFKEEIQFSQKRLENCSVGGQRSAEVRRAKSKNKGT